MPEPSAAGSFVALRPLEIAYGVPLGRHPGTAILSSETSQAPRAAFEAVLRTALLRPPCVISFSGGRDSSALLALATHVARSEGLPLPIPATLAFPGSAAADEDEWQQLVLARLGLEERVRLTFTDELDAVGPVAEEVLRRHGLPWPFNLHFHLPIIKLAAGGSVVTGFAGDELARSSTSVHAARLLRARRLEKPRDAAHLVLRALPRPLRFGRELLRTRDAPSAPWLTATSRRRVRVMQAADRASRPAAWGRLLRTWMWRSRYFQVCMENFAVMAAPFDVEVTHPFAAAPVLQSLASAGRFAGLGTRNEILDMLVGDLLPAEIIRRRSKAGFGDPIWTSTAERFAREWSGRGLDDRVVDPAQVRREWLGDRRDLLSTTLLQAAWLADAAAAGTPAGPEHGR